MQTSNNVHQQFAGFFGSEVIRPFAYLLSKKLSDGHICIDLNEIANEDDPWAFSDANTIINYRDQLPLEKLVSTTLANKQPFVLHKQKLYLQRYFHYESIILQRILRFAQYEEASLENKIALLSEQRKLLKNLFTSASPSAYTGETDWQLIAAISAVLNDFTIITGGPGTGKTTTVAKILAVLFSTDSSIKVALAAPTGKAAARMTESLSNTAINVESSIKEKIRSLEPSTLHRLLKVKPGKIEAGYHHNNPLPYDVLIVDESSMIDVALFAKLFDAIGDGTKLILLGDKDQLASVEAGSLFSDLCNAQPSLNLFCSKRTELINSFIEDKEKRLIKSDATGDNLHPLFQHVIELRQSHRFTGDKGIGRFSRAIINNDQATLAAFIEKVMDEQIAIDETYIEKVFATFIKDYEEYIRETDITSALAKFNRLRVLCATREGDHGVHAINKRIERLLQQKGLINVALEFYKHRPIMITQNYYELGLFNGDVGIIRTDESGALKAWSMNKEGKLKSVTPGFIADSETVYAMTIHKSQGSEFDNVLVMLPDNPDMPILTRELLYTAVTRAKTKVLVQAGQHVIAEVAKRRVKRASGIRERFIES